MPPIDTPASEYGRTVRHIAIMALVVVPLLIGVWLVGLSETATFRRVNPAFASRDLGIWIETDSHYQFVLPKTFDVARLKPGCRYSFNYDPVFGRFIDKSGPKKVRSVTLVDCPPQAPAGPVTRP